MTKANKVSVYFLVMLFIATIYSLFAIKSKVIILRSELAEVKTQIKLEKDSVHVLKAEMAYLASPERLNKLNNNYLHLKETHTKQLVQNPLEDSRDVEKVAIDGQYIVEEDINTDRSSKRIILSKDKSAQSSDIIKASYNKGHHNPVKWRYKKGPSKYTNRGD